MTFNGKKNLVFAIFNIAILLYFLFLNYSTVGLIGFGLTTALMMIVVFRKVNDDSIISKMNLYFFLSLITIVIIRLASVDVLLQPGIFLYGVQTLGEYILGGLRNLEATTLYLSVFAIILFIIGKKETPSGEFQSHFFKKILRHIFLFSISFATITLLWEVIPLTFLLLVGCIIGFLTIVDMLNKDFNKGYFRLSLIIVLLLISLYRIFPELAVSNMSLRPFIYLSVLSWGNVLLLTLAMLTMIGLFAYFKVNDGYSGGLNSIGVSYDEDSVFLSGLLGLIWTVKMSTYFYFSFSWVILIIFVYLWVVFTVRYLKNMKTKQKAATSGVQLLDNEMFLIAMMMILAILLLYFVSRGLALFFFGTALSILGIRFFPQIFSGWVKIIMSYQMVILTIAISASLFTVRSGFHIAKIIIILAICFFTSIVTWILFNKDQSPPSFFPNFKIAIVIIYSILVLTATNIGGVRTSITFTNVDAATGFIVRESSSLLREETGILVKIEPNSEDVYIVSTSYIWSDSFFYDEEEVIMTNETELTLPIEGEHLIIWVIDSQGVETRISRWFYRGY